MQKSTQGKSELVPAGIAVNIHGFHLHAGHVLHELLQMAEGLITAGIVFDVTGVRLYHYGMLRNKGSVTHLTGAAILLKVLIDF
jgi:hypothetical protein